VPFHSNITSLARSALLAVLVACADDPLSPFQPEITSATDAFQAQATDVTNVTATQTYTWSNTGSRATINHSTITASGAARLIVKDAAGVTVYDHALVPSLNEPTAVGTAGLWTVQLRFSSYSGTLNFRAEKL
jgi:hypothetical protein